MIPANTQIWLVAGVTDMRRGFSSLGGLVQSTLDKSPLSGQVFIFRKRPDFPSGIFIGLGLTIWSCIRQRELHIAFADFVRLQRSGRS
jgi:transposase